MMSENPEKGWPHPRAQTPFQLTDPHPRSRTPYPSAQTPSQLTDPPSQGTDPIPAYSPTFQHRDPFSAQPKDSVQLRPGASGSICVAVLWAPPTLKACWAPPLLCISIDLGVGGLVAHRQLAPKSEIILLLHINSTCYPQDTYHFPGSVSSSVNSL